MKVFFNVYFEDKLMGFNTIGDKTSYVKIIENRCVWDQDELVNTTFQNILFVKEAVSPFVK